MSAPSLAVLCIEDTASDFHLIERELRKRGLDCVCERVESSEAVREALANRHWDLVLSDYSVPGMQFTDTMKLFRRSYPDLPLILVSGTIGEVKARIMVELGASGFVPKRLLEDLVPTIELALQKSAAKQTEAGSKISTPVER
jgi:DNA-binding NtrC family response regulator